MLSLAKALRALRLIRDYDMRGGQCPDVDALKLIADDVLVDLDPVDAREDLYAAAEAESVAAAGFRASWRCELYHTVPGNADPKLRVDY